MSIFGKNERLSRTPADGRGKHSCNSGITAITRYYFRTAVAAAAWRAINFSPDGRLRRPLAIIYFPSPRSSGCTIRSLDAQPRNTRQHPTGRKRETERRSGTSRSRCERPVSATLPRTPFVPLFSSFSFPFLGVPHFCSDLKCTTELSRLNDSAKRIFSKHISR